MFDQNTDDLKGPISNHLNRERLYLIDDGLRVEFNEHRGSSVHKEPQLHDISVISDNHLFFKLQNVSALGYLGILLRIVYPSISELEVNCIIHTLHERHFSTDGKFSSSIKI